MPLTSNRQIGFGQLVDDLVDPQLAVGIGTVVEVEREGQLDAATDAGRDDHQIDRRTGEHPPEELDLGDVVAVGVEVVDEDAVEQRCPRAAVEQLADAAGVVADREPALDADLTADRDRDRDRADHDRTEVVVRCRALAFSVPASHRISVASRPTSSPKTWLASSRNGKLNPGTPNVEGRLGSGDTAELSLGLPCRRTPHRRLR